MKRIFDFPDKRQYNPRHLGEWAETLEVAIKDVITSQGTGLLFMSG